MYKLVGADGREYGPVTREAVLEWIAQGRANAQTIARFEEGAWKPLGTFEEFKDAFAAAVPPPLTLTAAATTFTSAEPPPFSGVGSRSETNTASVLGLVFGIVCCCCPYIGPVLGITFSLIGLSQIHSNPTRYTTSDALPKVGLVISVGVLLLHILGAIADAKLSRMFPHPF